jgi:hypothetical protein
MPSRPSWARRYSGIEPSKSDVAVENSAAFSRSYVALRIDLSSSAMATSGLSGISPRAVERPAWTALRHRPLHTEVLRLHLGMTR